MHLLPALPAAWPTGRVAGLRGRGGFTVSMAWTAGQADELLIGADRDGAVKLRARLFTAGFTLVDVTDGTTAAVTRPEPDCVRLTTRAGHTYRAARTAVTLPLFPASPAEPREDAHR